MADAEATLESRYVDVRGTRWHVRSGGPEDGPHPPVVLVHGLVISSVYMVPTAALLARDLRVHAPDLPGFGGSAKPAAFLDVPQMADALVDWMDAEGLQQASFLGNSLGCQVIADLAARRPERVERLVLIGPSADPDADAIRLAGRLLMDAPREDPKLLFLHLRDEIRAGAMRIWRTSQAALEDDILDKAGLIAAPTLVLRGEDDPIFPHAAARRLAKRLRNGLLVELPRAPHAANFSAPEAVVSAARDFLLGRHPAFPPSPRTPAEA